MTQRSFLQLAFTQTIYSALLRTYLPREDTLH